MEILEFAMKMELDGKDYYEKHAENASAPELKKILLSLAEEEARHYKFFKKLRDNDFQLTTIAELAGGKTLQTIKNIFEEMSQSEPGGPKGEDEIAVWTEALRLEEKAEKFYKDMAEKESNEQRKNLLLAIAGEEYNHVKMIDVVLMYLKHPADFLQSAQYGNFRSLEGM